ncbi:MAG: hypothetical protein M3R14_05300 [Acidobacteriota bacterium]|nr:hypothetical protein [Acidobacteriota bacterium]
MSASSAIARDKPLPIKVACGQGRQATSLALRWRTSRPRSDSLKTKLD